MKKADQADTKDELGEQYEDPICSITFQISQSGEIDLLAYWDTESHPVDMFAELLHHLTSAQLNALIVKSLLNIAETQISSTDFIMSMLNVWKQLVANTSEEPLISPSHVFGLTKPR